MPSTVTVATTGNSYIDGLLFGSKWASTSLTYSFPTSPSYYSAYSSSEPQTNFKAFTSVQQQAATKVLQNYAAVSNLQVTQVAESSATTGTIRYAETDAVSTAFSYFPSTAATGGDAWFNNSKHYYDNPIAGNYAYSILMHETGHTLGLKHPQDVFGAFGVLPSAHDSVEYSVMSYRSYIGGPLSYSIGATSYPQSLMMDDIRAIQTLYGADYTTNSGNTVYQWSPTTGTETINGVGQGAPAGNKVFMTIWDGGGIDTYDFSNYTTNLKVDLNPGAWTTMSSTQLAALGSSHYAAGNIANAYLYQGNTASLIENAIGGSGADILTGNQSNNVLTGGAGNDILNGYTGTDTAAYSGASTNYRWIQNSDGTWTVSDLRSGTPDGVDTLKNIDKLQFTDTVVTLTGTVSATANTNPVITSAPSSVSVTEWTDGSTNETNNVAHKASGTMTFWDPDLSDAHVASFVAKGTGYIGTFTLGAVNETLDTLSWSYAVSDSAMNFLGAGATRTQKYDVTIGDGHGGSAVQTVTFTLIGTSDVTTTTTTSAIGAAAIGPNEGSDGRSPLVDDSSFPSLDDVRFPHGNDANDFIGQNEGQGTPEGDQAPLPSDGDVQFANFLGTAADQHQPAADHLPLASHDWGLL